MIRSPSCTLVGKIPIDPSLILILTREEVVETRVTGTLTPGPRPEIPAVGAGADSINEFIAWSVLLMKLKFVEIIGVCVNVVTCHSLPSPLEVDPSPTENPKLFISPTVVPLLAFSWIY